MKILKTGLLFLAIFSGSLAFSADKAAAEITNVSQFVNLYGYSETGVISSFSQVLPNGTLEAYSIPQGKAVVIQCIISWFEQTPVQAHPDLHIGPYHTLNSIGSGMEKQRFLPIGFAVSDNNALNAKTIDANTGLVIPGKLKVQLIGYVLPLTAGRVPLDLLLLGKTPGLNNLMAQALLPNAFPRIAGQFPPGAIARQ